ncbi:MAG: hypothetical protein ACFFC7_34745 [Candidatus Hermodarchaeota archaeon]
MNWTTDERLITELEQLERTLFSGKQEELFFEEVARDIHLPLLFFRTFEVF